MMNNAVIVTSPEELRILISQAVEEAFEAKNLYSPPERQSDHEHPDFYTIKEICKKYGVTQATVWRHEKLGHIKGKRIGRKVLFPKEQIDQIGNFKFVRGVLKRAS